MKLRELQMFGFKSFADKTYLEFGDGITVVVGPNGSGKSNIFDAIRWVLGEQSAKSLRGGKMEDVIFIGSDSRKTLGMAEVSLVLDNQDKAVKIPYAELKITRRLYRSGESEYLINDNPVRLKDIVEIFMDTGIGIDSYSIISQGEVDAIINTKPIERREIFEEAAGITKYIKKRDEALRKLETTEENMVRINDILVEVRRQAGQLEKQAKKAEKYKELKQECGDISLKLYKKQMKDRKLRLNEYNEKKERIDAKIAAEDEGLKSYEERYHFMEKSSADMELAIAAKREKFVIKQEEIKRLENSRTYLGERISELFARIEDVKKENVENAGRIESGKLELEGRAAKISEKQGEINEKESETARFLFLLNKAAAEVDAEKAALVSDRKTLEALNAEFAALSGSLVKQEAEIANISEQAARIDVERGMLEESFSKTAIELEKISENRVLKEEEIKGIKEKEEFLIKEKVRKKQDYNTIDSSLKEMELVINRLESRLNFLRQLHEKMEGYGEAVRKVLFEFKKQLSGEERDAVIDAVGNIITVEKQYERAVEKSLGGVLQSVLVRDEAVIDELFSLYENEKGDLALLNISASAGAGEVLDSWKNRVVHKNIRAYLPFVISAGDYTPAARLLFHNIFIVEDAAAAKQVIEEVKIPDVYYLLTRAGALISSRGLYRKGEGETGAASGFLSREREMAEIEAELYSAAQKLASMGEERAFYDFKIHRIEKEIDELSITYHNQYVEVVKDSERIRQKESEKENLLDSLKKNGDEKREALYKKEILEKKKEETAAAAAAKETEIAAVKNRVEEAAAGISAKEKELSGKKQELEALKMAAITAKAELDVEVGAKNSVEERVRGVEESYRRALKEIEELAARQAQAEEERKNNENIIQENTSALALDETELNSLREESERFRGAMKELYDTIASMGRERERLKEEQYDVKLKINECYLEIKNIQDKILEEFKYTPEDGEIYSVEMSEEEHRELILKADEYREKMDRLGVINLVAIEEYNELKKRNDFLQSQYDDLAIARENLIKVIRKTNSQSKELFEKAFEEIRVKFSEVFVKMFNGGEADLVLTDKDNILESGIDIIARPPGKKLQNISLLSGGEKAITAISLLFSLFLIKASPFCVMDEIDAPLDDMNVVRLANLIKSFKSTQFIMISHNKITMEMADILYGVSMESAGVSQVVSVKLESVNKDGSFKAGRSAGREPHKDGKMDGEGKI